MHWTMKRESEYIEYITCSLMHRVSLLQASSFLTLKFIMHFAGNSENAHVNSELRNACTDETT